MKALAITAVCAGLAAAPLAVRAAELLVYGQAGEPVAILMPVEQSVPLGFPAELFARQDAIMRHMLSDIRALETGAPFGPGAMMPAFAPGDGAGSTVIMSSFSDGHGFCSQTVTYQGRANAAPIVQVRQSGDACGALPQPQATTPVADPPAQAAPRPALPGARLLRVDYRHPAKAAASQRG